MAEPSTVARPYAEAAFKLADASGSLAKWSEMLAALATVSQDPRVRAAVGDPNLPDAKVAGLFISILSLSGDGENFVRVLAEAGRLGLLPEVISAFELSAAQLADVVQRLEKKTGRKVRAKVQLDKELIGGIKVVLGDKVIDGSARGQLSALETALKA
jgi:F-type H+-transporting ATPase subunit delta